MANFGNTVTKFSNDQPGGNSDRLKSVFSDLLERVDDTTTILTLSGLNLDSAKLEKLLAYFVEEFKAARLAAITDLRLDNNSLTELPGLVSEIFPRLENLGLSRNDLRELDLTEFDRLNSLDISYNPSLAKLSAGPLGYVVADPQAVVTESERYLFDGIAVAQFDVGGAGEVKVTLDDDGEMSIDLRTVPRATENSAARRSKLRGL